MSQTSSSVQADGKIRSVSGPVVQAVDLGAKMNDVVYVGEEGLMGEVIEIEGNVTTIQVYEETSGVTPGEPVENTGEPLSVDLGPGLLDSIYDGVQRPLDVLEVEMGSAFLDRGVDAPGIDLEQTWEFEPQVAVGDSVEPGQVVGTVPETVTIEHKVLVPPDSDGGTVASVESGSMGVEEPVVTLESGEEITMHQEWPVREPRPAAEKQTPTEPLVTGQRIQDGLFPIAKGGTAAIPGPFGSGKCVTPETPVMLASGELVPIEELFDQLTDETVPDTGETLVEAEAEILTFDEDAGQIRPATTSHVYRGSTDRIINVRTSSGRELEITPDHKLFRMRNDLRIEETPGAALREGDSLIMPRQLDIDGHPVDIDPFELLPQARAMESHVSDSVSDALDASDYSVADLADSLELPNHIVDAYLKRNNPPLSFVANACEELDTPRPSVNRVRPADNGTPLTIPKQFDESFAEFLGLVLSDGKLTEKTLRFHNADADLRDRFVDLADELFDIDPVESGDNSQPVEIKSDGVSSLFYELGIPELESSRTASVPTVISSGPESVVAAFLRGYYLGNGSFSDDTVEIVPSSEELASGLAYLLARLGVLYRIQGRDEGSLRIEIDGADELAAFYTAIEAESDWENIERIGAYARSKTDRTTVDTVPVGPQTIGELAEGVADSVNPEKWINRLTNSGGGQEITRDGDDAIDQAIADGGAALADRLSTVTEIIDEVFFDPIVEIETIETEQPVYDVTVPGTENFIGGEIPSVLHNTVTQQQLARWSDADIVVYIGCGERGNEMTEVIEEFPTLEDPKTGNPLMARTCLVANTSNMPVAARESCVYTGITIAEYYRDMGYDVALMADSTSRWAEAMREISSRLEEMPGEEGYPAYLAARLSEFYERAGFFENVNGTEGSISVVGAVSPPGGDFNEPVTQNTLRIVKTFWALDADLAERRHFPAINWNESYSLYRNQLDPWWEENVAEDWPTIRQWAIDVLDEETDLQEIVQLVGRDALPEDQQLTLEVARYLREAFLQQNALHDVDTFCEPGKTYRILEAIKTYNDEAFEALEAGVPVDEIRGLESAPRLNRIGTTEEYESFVAEIEDELATELRGLYE